MVAIRIWDNFVGPPTVQGTNTFSYELGIEIVPTASIHVTGLRWYCPVASNAAYVPSRLDLWDGTTHGIIVSVTPTTPSSTGWQTVNLPTPLDLQAGQSYVVAIGWAASHNFTLVAQAPWLSSPLQYGSIPSRTGGTNSVGTFPGTSWAPNYPFVDIEATTTTSTPPGGSPATNDNLAAWLRTDTDNQHKDTSAVPGLPWVTKQAVDAARTVVDGIKSTTDLLGNASAGAIEKLNRWSDAGIDALNKASDLANNWPTLLNDRIFGTTSAGGSAFTGIGNAISDVQDQAGVNLALLREWLTLSPNLTDTTRWTLVGTTSSSGDALVTDQADLYVVSLTTIPSGLPTVVVDGVSWTPRWGWTAPRVHGSYRERQFNDLGEQAVTAGGLLMDGLLVSARPGVEWTVKAYVLDRS